MRRSRVIGGASKPTTKMESRQEKRTQLRLSVQQRFRCHDVQCLRTHAIDPLTMGCMIVNATSRRRSCIASSADGATVRRWQGRRRASTKASQERACVMGLCGRSRCASKPLACEQLFELQKRGRWFL